jgi:predicted phage replisome organizer/uncharacterized phage protein (TIGR02220 family)
MSENKKYYYLKFKENYFDQDHIKVIESMKNGYEYSLIILKLYLKSLKWEGQLMINENIPYMKDKIDLLAGVINHDPGNVMHAVNLAKDLGIIEIVATGEMFIKDIQNYIGHGSNEAERKAKYRKKIEDKVGQCPGHRPPELELELELEKNIKLIIDYLNDKCNKRFTYKNESYNKHISARIKEGYKVEDFYRVIDVKLTDSYFIENPKYYNPETLFRPSNFEKYLNEYVEPKNIDNNIDWTKPMFEEDSL